MTPSTTRDHVVLVDSEDRVLGTAPKLMAHQTGQLHRAVSAFVFDRRGRWLLQRRADGKYHAPGQWSNAACTHPRLDEEPHQAAARRLHEEMGVICGLHFAFPFLYRADVGGGLTEHEYDHVFVGRYDGVAEPDPAEASAWQWLAPGALASNLREAPDRYTPWFRLLYPCVAADAALPPLD